MALFASPAVKDLKKQSAEIGSMIGQAGLGMLSASDVSDVIANEDWRQRLRTALRVASQEMGEDKAIKTATKAARSGAEPWVRQSQANILYCYDRAEEAVRSMLGK
jgi:hypothetical protein